MVKYRASYNLEWKEGNREKLRTKSKNYYESNRGTVAEKNKIYREENKEKIRGQKLSYKYGVSLATYNYMYEKQNGLCYICGKEQTRRPLCVDHCHETGVVRHLLCDRCNLVLGSVKDDSTLLIDMASYLKEFK